MGWNLWKINDMVSPSGPGAIGINGHELFVSEYNYQSHYAYFDGGGNIQDAWLDQQSGAWHLQQINNANGLGPTVPGEYIASKQATAPAVADLFVSVYGDQQHFAYRDANGHIQDVWYDSQHWHLQQINGPSATVPNESIACAQAPPSVGQLFVSVYNGQHFSYFDANGNIQDVWYDPQGWHLQQINNANGLGPTVPGEYIASKQATAPAEGDLFVSIYVDAHGYQQHFSYRDTNSHIQDVWYDSQHWHLQQINGPSATVLNESIAVTAAPAAFQNLFVGVGQHFVYLAETSFNHAVVWDAWYYSVGGDDDDDDDDGGQ
jgi:hypothetical protein